MDTVFLRELLMLIIALVGALSIFLGYKLFCEIPFGRTRGMHVVNGVSGALLALFGMAMLCADLNTLRSAPDFHQAVHQARPAEAGSFTNPRSGHHRVIVDWQT